MVNLVDGQWSVGYGLWAKNKGGVKQ